MDTFVHVVEYFLLPVTSSLSMSFLENYQLDLIWFDSAAIM